MRRSTLIPNHNPSLLFFTLSRIVPALNIDPRGSMFEQTTTEHLLCRREVVTNIHGAEVSNLRLHIGETSIHPAEMGPDEDCEVHLL